jgi:hypothetical protein
MEVNFQTLRVWDAVHDGISDDPDEDEYHDDRQAMAGLLRSVPSELWSTLARKGTAKEAWEAIKKIRIGNDRVRKAIAQNLRAEYEAIALRDGEPIDDFTLRLTGIVQCLATLGDPEPDEKVVAKYLRVVRPCYKQLVISIETLLDISRLSIEEVTGRLKAADDVEPAPAHTANGKLLLTEEQWVEKYKKDRESS